MTDVFDSLLRKAFLDFPSITKPVEAFPPYNIIQTSEFGYSIELAVAGYSREDLSVQVEEDVLHVIGSKSSDESPIKYLYKGMASRSFTRKFTLSDSVLVKGVSLKDGILSIELERILPKDRNGKKFLIK